MSVWHVCWGRADQDRARRTLAGRGLQGGLDSGRQNSRKETRAARPAGGGVIYSETLLLELECRVLHTAHEAGIRAPKSYGYIEDLMGREAFVMERLEGEGIGYRIVQRPSLRRPARRLPISWRKSWSRSTPSPWTSFRRFLEPGPSRRRTTSSQASNESSTSLGSLIR